MVVAESKAECDSAVGSGKIELKLHPPDDDGSCQPQLPMGPDGNKLPDLIPLRLPMALLASLTNESRFALRCNPKEDDSEEKGKKIKTNRSYYSISILHGNDSTSVKDLPDKQREIKVETEKSTAWYQSKSKGKSTGFQAKTNDLFQIGVTNRRYTVETSSVIDVKKIGKRARNRFEEERKKRKEIIRLEENLSIPLSNKEKNKLAKSLSDANKVDDPGTSEPPAKKSSKITKATTTRKKSATSKRKRNDPHIDSWMPDTDKLIENSVGKEDQSYIVRLHGLPLGVKPEHIRKFFHGLSPSLIFSLPSFPHHVEGWDVAYGAGYTKKCIVQRHPSDFRVFVKFASAPVAVAAMERSGESIGLEERCSGKGGKEITSAAISLSPVSRQDATYLLKHLAITAQKGESITQSVSKVERKLGSVVDLAWSMAIKKINLKQRVVTVKSTKALNCYNFLSQVLSVPTDLAQYHRLGKLYNRLIDRHEKLELDLGLIYTYTFDPSCLEDPTHRISQAVSNWILDEIYLIGGLLKEARAIIKS